MVAKWVSDAASHSLYHAQLDAKCVPFLPPEPVSRFSLDLLPVTRVMRSPVVCMKPAMSVSGLSGCCWGRLGLGLGWGWGWGWAWGWAEPLAWGWGQARPGRQLGCARCPCLPPPPLPRRWAGAQERQGLTARLPASPSPPPPPLPPPAAATTARRCRRSRRRCATRLTTASRWCGTRQRARCSWAPSRAAT
jgi:hypothetical protein